MEAASLALFAAKQFMQIQMSQALIRAPMSESEASAMGGAKAASTINIDNEPWHVGGDLPAGAAHATHARRPQGWRGHRRSPPPSKREQVPASTAGRHTDQAPNITG